jgi:hypothetical protein
VTSFTASVTVDDGMLHTSRPVTAPEDVTDLISSVFYAVQEGAGTVVSVELTIETSGESDTPIADSTAGTASTPLQVDTDTPIDPTSNAVAR